MDTSNRTQSNMRGKCIEKVFRIVSQNKIEFKLAVSAILLSFGEESGSPSAGLNDMEDANREESNYVLKIIMTSFNPIELTTKLGGPWEGYFLWDTIRGKIFGSAEKDGGQKQSLLNFVRMMDDSSCYPEESSPLSIRLMNFGEYVESALSSGAICGAYGESMQEKDYLLAIKLEGVDSEMMLHLRSTSNPDYHADPSSLESISIMKCLKDVVELIKQENYNLHENLRSLAEFSVNQKQTANGNTIDEETQYDANSCRDNNASDSISRSPAQSNSPNTRGTLELSELRDPSYLNSLKVTGLLDSTSSSPPRPIFEKQSVTREIGNLEMNYGHANSRLTSSEALHSQMKTYRFIKKDSDSASYKDGYYSTSSHPACCCYSSSAVERSSALRSALESIRRNRNELLSKQADSPPSHVTGRLDFNKDNVVRPSYKATSSDFDYFQYSKCFQKLNKSRERPGNFEQHNSSNDKFRNGWNRNNFELKTPENPRKSVPLYTREQLMNKLSNTRDISERINILKNMIKSTKKESYHFDEFD